MKGFFMCSMLAATLLAGSTYAQDARPKKEGRIRTREERQQKRIAEGIENGALQPGEAAKLENQEHRLNQEVREDRKENGGNLTEKEKRQINRQQNRLSKEIYKNKHNEKK